jgi:hypothetical protein
MASHNPSSPLIFLQSRWRVAVVFVLVFVALILLFLPKSAAFNRTLGQCLTDKGVTMYGVDTCQNCQDQKQILGDDFAKVTYVNCDFDKASCDKKGITFYPIWSMGNKVLLGTQTKKALSEFAGC